MVKLLIEVIEDGKPNTSIKAKSRSKPKAKTTAPTKPRPKKVVAASKPKSKPKPKPKEPEKQEEDDRFPYHPRPRFDDNRHGDISMRVKADSPWVKPVWFKKFDGRQ